MQVCRCSKGTRHLTLQVINSNDSVMKTGCTYLRPVFYFYFHEILVDSRLATRRIGEQKFCRLQPASSTHNMATVRCFKIFAQIRY